jgi:hemerythrin superfamily protein
MDAIELLKKDHDAVEQLFQRFSDGGGLTGVVKRLTGTGAQPRQRRDLAQRICKELEVHALIEEEIFYPAVRTLNDQKLNAMLDESEREHATLKERVSATEDALDDDEDLQQRVGSLQDCVTHHVREEEGEMFPRLADLMPANERARIGRELAARKRSAGGASRPPAKKTHAPVAGRGRSSGRVRKTAAKARKSTATAKHASGGRRR